MVVETTLALGSIGVADGVGAQVQVGVEELLDQRAEGVRLGQPRDLVAELEVVEDVLDVPRKAIQVLNEVIAQLLLTVAGAEVAKSERRGVVEGLAGGLAQGGVLVCDVGTIEGRLHVEDRILGRLQHGVEAPQNRHGEDDVAVLAAHVQVAEHIVCDSPDKIGYLAMQCSVQYVSRAKSITPRLRSPW